MSDVSSLYLKSPPQYLGKGYYETIRQRVATRVRAMLSIWHTLKEHAHALLYARSGYRLCLDPRQATPMPYYALIPGRRAVPSFVLLQDIREEMSQTMRKASARDRGLRVLLGGTGDRSARGQGGERREDACTGRRAYGLELGGMMPSWQHCVRGGTVLFWAVACTVVASAVACAGSQNQG